MATWKAYWIMRGVEAYLIRTHDYDATELVSQIINQFEYEMANVTRDRNKLRDEAHAENPYLCDSTCGHSV